MAKKILGPRIVTANRLDDGLVVFLGPDGDWERDYRKARIAHADDEAEILESAAQVSARENIVVDPYLVELKADDGDITTPLQHREFMRTVGPTVGNSVHHS